MASTIPDAYTGRSAQVMGAALLRELNPAFPASYADFVEIKLNKTQRMFAYGLQILQYSYDPWAWFWSNKWSSEAVPYEAGKEVPILESENQSTSKNYWAFTVYMFPLEEIPKCVKVSIAYSISAPAPEDESGWGIVDATGIQRGKNTWEGGKTSTDKPSSYMDSFVPMSTHSMNVTSKRGFASGPLKASVSLSWIMLNDNGKEIGEWHNPFTESYNLEISVDDGSSSD